MTAREQLRAHRDDIPGAVESAGYASALATGGYILGHIHGSPDPVISPVGEATTQVPESAILGLWAAIALIVVGAGTDYLIEEEIV